MAAAQHRRTLTRIALDCGFADGAHLSRSFRSAYGVPPAGYRRTKGTGGSAG